MPTHEYIEITIPLPARVTSHVDQLGNLRLRVNKRDLTRLIVLEVQDRLHDAGVEFGKALPEETL